MEEENVQEGLTFGEIWRMVLHRIWYILGAAALTTIIAVLIVYFAVNPGARSYSMEFSLVFPTGSEYTYPDGEPFFYQTMISAASLGEAKKGEGLTSIDTDKMSRKGDVSVTAETVTENGETKYTGRYTVSAKSSYFSGAEQAEKFIRAIAQVTEDKMHTDAGNVDYTVSKETFESAPFEERLNLLAQERETLLDKYDEWIEIYDAAYKPIEGNNSSLKEFRAAVTALFGESVQKGLETELKAGGYYYTADAEGSTEKFDAYKATLKAEYNRNKTEIEELRKSGASAQSIAYSAPIQSVIQSLATTSSSSGQQKEERDIIVQQPALNVSQRLAALIERNANILQWLGSTELGEKDGENKYIEPQTGTLTAEKNTAFAARLDAERVKLAGAAAGLTSVTKGIYDRGMRARFDVQKVQTEGGVSVILVAVAAFIVALLVACCVVCVVDKNRKKKAEQPTTDAEAQPEEPKEE